MKVGNPPFYDLSDSHSLVDGTAHALERDSIMAFLLYDLQDESMPWKACQYAMDLRRAVRVWLEFAWGQARTVSKEVAYVI